MLREKIKIEEIISKSLIVFKSEQIQTVDLIIHNNNLQSKAELLLFDFTYVWYYLLSNDIITLENDEISEYIITQYLYKSFQILIEKYKEIEIKRDFYNNLMLSDRIFKYKDELTRANDQQHSKFGYFPKYFYTRIRIFPLEINDLTHIVADFNHPISILIDAFGVHVNNLVNKLDEVLLKNLDENSDENYLNELEDKKKFPVIKGVGWGNVKIGSSLEEVEVFFKEKGKETIKFKHAYFYELPNYGLQIVFSLPDNLVDTLYFFNNDPNKRHLLSYPIITDKQIDWNSKEEDIVKAYGIPKRVFEGKINDKIISKTIIYEGIEFEISRDVLIQITIRK
jgi:hypothetical protein